MKYVFIIVILNFLNLYLCAAPPKEYVELNNVYGESLNKHFYYEIIKDSTYSSRGWKLLVYSSDSILFWEKQYKCDWEPEGFLQNDGKHFIDFNTWNSEESIVITIYRKDTANIEITGKFFNIPKDSLIEHTDYIIEWFKSYKIQNDSIIIHTNDDIIWSINYKNGIANKKQYNHIVKTKSLLEDNLFIVIIIMVLSIFFLILFIRKKIR